MTQERDTGAHPVGGSTGGRDSTHRDYSTDRDHGTDRDYDSTSGSRSYSEGERHTETRSVPVHEERVVHQESRPVHREGTSSAPVNVAVDTERKDGVRWGPIWAGLLTALTTFVLLELLFAWLGVIDLNAPEDARLVTGILALVAFFIGGLIAGATALWKGLFSGLLHGFLVWALGVVSFIALTFFGASALLGSFGDLTSQLGVGPQEVQSATEVSEAEQEQAREDAQDAAGPAFWGLLLPLLAAMLGGLIGSKIWPRKKDIESVRVDNRH